MQQYPAQTLAWDLSMSSFTSGFSVLLGPRNWCGILQVFHNSAKAQCVTEPFGLSLIWSHVVTPVCDTVELRSGLCLLLPRFWKGSASTLRLGGYLLPKEWGRVCTGALLQGCRELAFNSVEDSILETNFSMQPLARLQLNAIKSNIQHNTCPKWDFKVAH